MEKLGQWVRRRDNSAQSEVCTNQTRTDNLKGQLKDRVQLAVGGDQEQES
jgi:hypothetical protein